MHRQQHIPAPLQSHRHHPGGVLAAGDVAPVHRRPHRLHRRRNTLERDGHVLLDLFHVHGPQQADRQGREGCRPSWSRVSRRRRGRDQVPQVLPVGVFRALLPGHPFLRAEIPVEDLGGRPHQIPDPRPELPHSQRTVQGRSQKGPRRILFFEHTHS